ncbi:M13 family metallopeptidase [Sphingomonas swuensis]
MAAVACALAGSLLSTAAVATQKPGAGLPPMGPDQMVFSIANMDRSVSPGQDFYRYAAGGWLTRVQRPERHASYGFFEIVADRVQDQMGSVLQKAGQDAATAPKGSPAQQVGTFYNAYMDVGARRSAGLRPIRSFLDRVDQIQDMPSLARFMANSQRDGGPTLFLVAAPDIDFRNSKENIIYLAAGGLGLSSDFEDVFEEPDGGPRISGYRTYLVDTLKIAGFDAAKAAAMADLSIRIDRTLHAAKLPPAEAGNPAKLYNPRTIAQLRNELSSLDVGLLLDELQFGSPERLILAEPRYLPALSRLLAGLSMAEVRDYARARTILTFTPYLSPDFDKPLVAFSKSLTGVGVLPPQEQRALDLITQNLGQPVSKLYVDNFFPAETRQQASEMVGLIKGAFVERMPNRAWLSDPTRTAAIAKLDALQFAIGYPDEWIDYRGVTVTPDLVDSKVALARFDHDRLRNKIGRPAKHDYFATSKTLPMIVNAGYDPQLNGFEVPAAIIQVPMFDAKADPAVNFCRMGAVLGHEMTHGFDWSGKQFDGSGNMRNWWQPVDDAAFDKLAGGLVAQANSYEFLPGKISTSGAQQVGENMADLGGITLAHAALRAYLAKHPDKDVPIDGLSQDQRCFLAWSQLWAWKGQDQMLQSLVARDPHPPNAYRATAPLRHLDAFYSAFGIKEGDEMWLSPEKRVRAW